jgi:ATP-dependent Zn protease
MGDMPEVLKETAYHEAGHVVMGHVVGRNAVSVTIIREGDAAGLTRFAAYSNTFGKLDESREKANRLRALVLSEIAGSAAHDILYPRADSDGFHA